MTKKEIFNKICQVTAEVCDVTTDNIINGCKEDDAVMARSIVVFWCYAAGFGTQDIAKQAGVSNATQVNNIKAKIEEYWIEKYIYHMVVAEVGKKLAEYAGSIVSYFSPSYKLTSYIVAFAIACVLLAGLFTPRLLF